MDKEFYRISRLPPYVFSEVNSIKSEARAKGEDVIDFGMGNPDSPTPPHIVEKLREAALDPKAHRYSISSGIPGLKKALAGYYERRFNVSVDPAKEVAVSLGSKEGFAHFATAITKPGDVILVPNPSYPIHAFGFIIAEAAVKYLARDFSRNMEEDMMEQLKIAVEDSAPKPSVLVINYPSNPTTETATLEFYEQIVDFCKFHDIILVSDLAYCDIYFDEPPPSILQVKGAKDIAIEFTSMSKTYSMAGWRVGFAAGNEHLVGAMKRIKSYLDYGAFTPIQVAAAAALNGPQDCVEELRQLYKKRRDVLISGLDDAGWKIEPPKASMFIWAPLPEKFADMGSLKFSKLLLEKANVAVSPGIGFGQHGDGHVRIGLIENIQRSRQAIRNIRQILK